MLFRYSCAFSFVFLICFGVSADPGTTFTYQGELIDNGSPAESDFDFELSLWDAETSGTQVGSTLTPTLVSVANGLVELELDFGAGAFDGEARWLEIAVRPSIARGNSFTTLTPRRAILPAPQAQYAELASSALNDAVDDADADPANELNLALMLTGTQLALEDAGGTITVELASLQDGSGTDNQTLSFVSPNLSIEDGNSVDLSALQDGVDDADADPGNEIQTLAEVLAEGNDAAGTAIDNLGNLTFDDAILGTGGSRTINFEVNQIAVDMTGDLQGGVVDLDLGSDNSPADIDIVVDRLDTNSPFLVSAVQPAGQGDPLGTVPSGPVAEFNGDALIGTATTLLVDMSASIASSKYAAIFTGGNVGIGTATPSEALTVEEGNILQTPADPVVVASVGIGPSPQSIHVSGRYGYVVDFGSDDLKIIDISDPTSPEITGSLGIGGDPRDIHVSGRYAYVIDLASDDLKVIDVSNPSAPSLTGSHGIGGEPRDVYVSGRYAYVIDSGSDDLKVIDVSDPAAPALSGTVDIGVLPAGLYVSGRYAYVTDLISEDLKVIDVSDPALPTVIGSLGIGGSPRSVHVSGRYAYVVDATTDDLKVIEVSNPALPTVIGSLGIGGSPRSVHVSGRYAYVVDSDSDDLKVIDVSIPASPTLAGSINVGSYPSSLHVSGRYAYVTDTSAADLKVIDISGGEMTSLIAHSLEAGNLQVRNNIVAQGELQVTGGITAGGSALISGDLGVSGDELEVNGRIVVRDPANNGAIILSPSNDGSFGEDPEFVIQSSESGSGNTAPFHLSRNAIFQTSNDTYQFIDDEGAPASSIQFENDGDISFHSDDASTGTITFEESFRIAASGRVYAPKLFVGTAVAPLGIAANGEIIRSISSAQFKENIEDAHLDAEKILELNAVTYNYKETGELALGYIAEQLDELGLKHLVVYDNDGKPYAIAYQLIPLFQNELIKQHQAEIESHEERLAEKDAEIEAQQRQIDGLRAEMDELKAFIQAGSE